MRPSARTDRQVSFLITVGSLVLIAGQTIPEFLSQQTLFSPWWNVAGLMCAAVFVLMAAVGLWLPLRALRALWLVMPLVVFFLNFLSFSAFTESGAAIPWVWTMEPTAVSLAVLVVRPVLAVGLTVLSGFTVGASAWVFTGAIPRDIAAATPIHLSNVGFVAIFIGIRAALTALRRAEQDARHAAESQASATAHAERQEEFGRFVHDEVLSVMNAALLFEGPPPQVLRAEAGTAVTVLTEGRASSERTAVEAADIAPMLQARLVRIVGDADWVIQATGPAIPGQVVKELADAAAEAARNVAMHAQATVVTITVHVVEGAIDVTMRDNGRGFEGTSALSTRWGVQASILGRLEGIGGQATITSRAGEGTEVRLSWSPT